jgi:ribose transport system permease protein
MLADDAIVPPRVRRSRSRLGALARSNLAGLVIAIAVFSLAFGLLTDGFISRVNIYSLSRSIAINGVIGLGMMTVLVTGGLNLAFGAIAVCAAMVMGYVVERTGLGLWSALIAGALAGAMLGAINGLIVVRTRLHSFVVTLATMSIFFGIMVLLSGANGFNALPRELTGFGRIRMLGLVSPLLLVMFAVAGLLFRALPLYCAWP